MVKGEWFGGVTQEKGLGGLRVKGETDRVRLKRVKGLDTDGNLDRRTGVVGRKFHEFKKRNSKIGMV